MYEDVILEIGHWPRSAMEFAEGEAVAKIEAEPYRILVRGRGATAEGSFAFPVLPPDPQKSGLTLFETVFADPAPRDLFVQCVSLVAGRNAVVEPGDEMALRIRLILDLEGADFARVNALPWELLSPPNRGSFVLSRHTSLVRAPNLGEPVRRQRLPEILRVLVVMPDPQDPALGSLNLEGEWDNLRMACAGREHRMQLERLDRSTSGRPMTRAALRRALLDAHRRRRPFHVVHFMGHGVFDAKRNEGWLVFENQAGGAAYVSGDQLAQEMMDFLPSLVVLNACDTAAAFGYLGGVAHRLLARGLSAVVGMQRRISDPAAISFAAEFYRALAAGDAVDAAMTEARLGVDRETGVTAEEWWVPVLFLRNTEGHLFQVHRQDLVASLTLDLDSWKQQVEELRRQVAEYADMPSHSVRIVGSPREAQVKIELPEAKAREVLSGWRRGESSLRDLPITRLERPWQRRVMEAIPFPGLALAFAVWDGFLLPWIHQRNAVVSIHPPGEPGRSLVIYLTICALVLLAWALQRRFLPTNSSWEPWLWRVALVFGLILGQMVRPPSGVEVSTYLEGRLDTGRARYAYLFVRPIEGATCWLQGSSPLVISPDGRWRTQVSFGGSPGQRYEVIALASWEALHPLPFSGSDAYSCDQLGFTAPRTVQLMEKR